MIDPAADTLVSQNAFLADGDGSAIPNAVLATDISIPTRHGSPRARLRRSLKALKATALAQVRIARRR